MQTRFVCEKCAEIKVEIWICQPEPHADDGYEEGFYVCKECRERLSEWTRKRSDSLNYMETCRGIQK